MTYSEGLICDVGAPVRSVHGFRCAHDFEPGSSGAFGEETAEPWMSASEALANYKGIVILEQVALAVRKGILRGSFEEFLAAFGDVPSWHDTHARHGSYAPPGSKTTGQIE